MIVIRDYRPSDWDSIEHIHDAGRKIELRLACLENAFIPLRIAAGREGLFEYEGLFVAEDEHCVVGFIACSEEELAWLYVDPARMRQGIGRGLAEYAIKRFPGIRYTEVLAGNDPAKALYESLGFFLDAVVSGVMPGNEDFSVTAYRLERKV